MSVFTLCISKKIQLSIPNRNFYCGKFVLPVFRGNNRFFFSMAYLFSHSVFGNRTITVLFEILTLKCESGEDNVSVFTTDVGCLNSR